MIAAIVSYFSWGLLGKLWKGFCDFITTPIGAALIAGLVMYNVGLIHEYRKVNATWQAKWDKAESLAETARIRRDQDIQKAMAVNAEQRIAALATRKAELEQKVKAYEDEEAQQLAVGNVGKTGVVRCSPNTDSSDELWLRDATRGHVLKTRRKPALRLRTFSR